MATSNGKIADAEIEEISDEKSKSEISLKKREIKSDHNFGNRDAKKEGDKNKNNSPLMREYTALVAEINAQNNCLTTLKQTLLKKTYQKSTASNDLNEIRNLRGCIERENLKLQTLLKSAMTLQEKDPLVRWDEIAIATTFEEDSVPMNLKPSKIVKTFRNNL